MNSRHVEEIVIPPETSYKIQNAEWIQTGMMK